MRENELEQRQMEAAKILAALRKQEGELQEIIDSQNQNSMQLENLHTLDILDIQSKNMDWKESSVNVNSGS